MPINCTVCSKKYYSKYQKILQCTTCDGWVHHGNRLDCSGLTDIEFEHHVQDEHKPFECQKCFSEKKSQIESLTDRRYKYAEIKTNFDIPTSERNQEVPIYTSRRIFTHLENLIN